MSFLLPLQYIILPMKLIESSLEDDHINYFYFVLTNTVSHLVMMFIDRFLDHTEQSHNYSNGCSFNVNSFQFLFSLNCNYSFYYTF